MKTTRIIVPVQHPDDIAVDEVAAAINQLLAVGYADACDTAQEPDIDNPDAQRAAALTIGPPAVGEEVELPQWAPGRHRAVDNGDRHATQDRVTCH